MKVCFTINVATLAMDWYSKALCAFQDVVAAINKFNSHVVGVPVTLNGDLNNQFVQPNVGFDTICKVNSQLISNVCTDALSVEKYYYFIRLMGRKAYHVALECTLQSHPNMVILGEEVPASKLTIFDLTEQIRDAVQAMAEEEKYHGVILLLEGLIESIPVIYALLQVKNTGENTAEDPNRTPGSEADVSLRSSRMQDVVDDDSIVVQNTDCSPSGKSLSWEVEDSNAPNG